MLPADGSVVNVDETDGLDVIYLMGSETSIPCNDESLLSDGESPIYFRGWMPFRRCLRSTRVQKTLSFLQNAPEIFARARDKRVQQQLER